MLTSSNIGKFQDRNPDIVPAGKLFTCKETARNCLEVLKLQPSTLTTVHKFRCTTQPKPGEKRIFYGRYNDPDVAASISHGVGTKASLLAKGLVHPQPKSYFQHRLNEKIEEDAYKKRDPLGRSRNQLKGRPADLVESDHLFGLPTTRDVEAGKLINPRKSYRQVQAESKQGFELYKKSHNVYDVGESCNRGYNWYRSPSSCFGLATPHDNRGLDTKKTLKWLHETQNEKAMQLVSKRVDDFRERNVAQVGFVHDPIKNTMHVPKQHTFGIMVKPDEFGAGDLIHMRTKGSFLRGKERVRGVLAAVRQHLKKANYHNFKDLKAAFAYYDKNKTGKIELKELQDICHQFNLPIETDLLKILLECCNLNSDHQFDYIEFTNFLNWKDKMPSGFSKKCEDAYSKKIIEEAKESGMKIDDKGNVLADTLNNQLDDSDKTVADKKLDTNQHFRAYGTPTIRSDLPAPMIRRIGDNTNYGDESDAHGLMNPSIYSNYGVYAEDFFKHRQPGEMFNIFSRIDIKMTNEAFQTIWQTAREYSEDGKVSVESFREVLDTLAAQEFQGQSNFSPVPHPTMTSKPSFYETLKTKSLTC